MVHLTERHPDRHNLLVEAGLPSTKITEWEASDKDKGGRPSSRYFCECHLSVDAKNGGRQKLLPMIQDPVFLGIAPGRFNFVPVTGI